MKLYESLFILRKSADAVKSTWDLVNPLNGNKHADHVKIHLFNMILLEAVIFFEEFDGYRKNIEPQFHERMKDVAKMIGPIRKKINLQHLQNFRNSFIAHAWRDKKGNFIKPDDAFYKVPRNLLEVNLLAYYITYIDALLKAEFEKETLDTTLYMMTQIPPPLPTRDYSNLNAEQIQMAYDVDEIAISLNKPYRLKVMVFEFPDEVKPESKHRQHK